MGLFDWLWGKKAAARTTWHVGERVLARWHDAYFYPGRVRAVRPDGCQIQFDDGDVDWVPPAHVLRPDVAVGSKVFARAQGGPAFLPGTVRQQKGETLQVHYDQGGEEWTSLSMVRVRRDVPDAAPAPMTPGPATPEKPVVDLGEPADGGEWRVGDRALARWVDLFWYPATILGIGSKGFHVLYDDGDQRVITHAALMPLVVEEGEHVFIRPKAQPQLIYGPAVVTRVEGERLDVEFEDGAVEANTTVSRARFWRSPVRVRDFPFEEGDRVLAQDVDDYVYPAEIVAIQEDRIDLHFLDGPQRMLTPERIRRFELRPGLRVECRWKGGPHYFPGTLRQVDGERAAIDYDDGDKEWTTVRLVRLPPGT